MDQSNLSDDDSCPGFLQGDPKLAPLADNGGPTLTHIPLYSSDALGSGDPIVCQSAPINGFDQRGEERSIDECDIGSTEVEYVFPIYMPLVVTD